MTGSFDEAYSENQGLEESSIAGSLGPFSPCLQNLASKGAWTCLLPVPLKPQTTSSGQLVWKGQGGFPLSISSTQTPSLATKVHHKLVLLCF